MGSESPRSIRFNLTGFKKFHGVTDNPTEILVGKIEEHMRKHGMPSGAILGSCSVLETAGEGALDSLILLLNSESEQTIIGKAGGLPGVQLLQAPIDQVVWVGICSDGAFDKIVRYRHLSFVSLIFMIFKVRSPSMDTFVSCTHFS